MRDRSNSREKAETVRKRGFGLSRPVLCIALSLTLVIGCIPHDDPITSAKADAVLPAVGAVAAAATALGITETELIAGCMAMLAVYCGVNIDWSSMYGSLSDPSDYSSAIDTDVYGSNVAPYVDWRDLGLDIPDWGDMGLEERNEWGGQAWHYDEAVWYAWWVKFMGLEDTTPPSPGDGGNNNNNRKWNLLKLISKDGAGAAAALGATLAPLYWLYEMYGHYSKDGGGQLIFDRLELDGKPCPMTSFSIYGIDDYNNEYTDCTIGSWWIGCRSRVYVGLSKVKDQFTYYGSNVNSESMANFIVQEQDGKWYLRGQNIRYYGVVQYDAETGAWSHNSDANLLNGARTSAYLGQTLEIDETGTVITDKTYFINTNYSGGYTFRGADGVDLDYGSLDKDHYYDLSQIEDFPQDLAKTMYDQNVTNYNNYFNTMEPSTTGQVLTLNNPYYDGNPNPSWNDFFDETPEEDVYDVPETNPGETPVPDPAPNPEPEPDDPDYDDRLNRIAQLAFSQAFPFCLINDIKLLSDKFVAAGSANPDFSVDIPLEDFGIEGVEVLTLDANHPSTGGGLLELGDYTRPLITIVFIGLLLGFSIKLFLR